MPLMPAAVQPPRSQPMRQWHFLSSKEKRPMKRKDFSAPFTPEGKARGEDPALNKPRWSRDIIFTPSL